MSKILKITFDEKVYTLEFTRKTASVMERQGFSLAELTDKPATMVPMLFAGAFAAHHPTTKAAVIENIYNSLTNRGDLMGKLAEMYADPINTLLDDPEDGEKGNAMWEANW